MTNFADLSFSDEEIICIYLHGVMEGYRTLKLIHQYANRHLRSWFPKLPGYVAFDQRVNQVCDVFIPLLELLTQEIHLKLNPDVHTGLTDAMPIIMAQRSRRFHAKVAPQIATKNGYCATKRFHYYGVKLPVVAYRQAGKLPKPVCIGLTDAGMHDRKAFEQILPFLPETLLDCFADKAYQIENASVHAEHAITLFTPVKKAKGQVFLEIADQWLSTAVSKVRQPIESFFNWVNEKTGIQMASKVRSYKGLMVHVFGRLAAAMFIMQSKQVV